jgi:hypothetical protein
VTNGETRDEPLVDDDPGKSSATRDEAIKYRSNTKHPLPVVLMLNKKAFP